MVGQWVPFPTTAEELQRVFSAIGIGKPDACGVPYEEWFVTAYESRVRGLSSALGEFVNLDELNYLAVKLNSMEQSELEEFEAALEMDIDTLWKCGSQQTESLSKKYPRRFKIGQRKGGCPCCD